jgi:hypothetical protein
MDINKIQFGTQIKTTNGITCPKNAKIFTNGELKEIKNVGIYQNETLKKKNNPLKAAYLHDHPDNGYRWAEITGVQDELLGDEMWDDDSITYSSYLKEGNSYTQDGNAGSLVSTNIFFTEDIYCLEFDYTYISGIISFLIGSEYKGGAFLFPSGHVKVYYYCSANTYLDFYSNSFVGTISNISVKKVLSGTPIGTKYLTSLHDLTGNDNHWTFPTDTAQPLAGPDGHICDGTAQYGEITIDEYLPDVQSNDDVVEVVYNITSVEDEVLGEELIVNGDFSNGISSWFSAADAILSIVDGKMHVDRPFGGGACQDINVKYKSVYKLTVEDSSASVYIYGTNSFTPIIGVVDGDGNLYFSALSNFIRVYIYANNTDSSDTARVSIQEVSNQSKITGYTNLKLGKSATGSFESETFKHASIYSRSLSTPELSAVQAWEAYDEIKTRDEALKALQWYNPVALWVPGMQSDGFRVSGDKTYLTQLTDLGLQGNHAVQGTDTAQAYLDGYDAVFSRTQYYALSNMICSGSITACIGYAWIDDPGLPGILFSANGHEMRFGRYYVESNSYGAFVNGEWDQDLNETGNKTFKCFNGTVAIGDIEIYIGSYFARPFGGTISTIGLYNRTLTTQEQSVVNHCLNILGGN